MKLSYSETAKIILMILISNLMHSQIPSINQVKSFSNEQKSLININENTSINSIDTIAGIDKKNIPNSKAQVTDASNKLVEEIQKFKLDSIKLNDINKENQRLKKNITNLKSLINNHKKLELEKKKEIDTLESNLKKFDEIVKKQIEDISKQNKKVEEQNELVKVQDVKIQKLETKVYSEKKYEAQNYIDYYEKVISEKKDELNKLIHIQSDETTKTAKDSMSLLIKKCEEDIEKLKNDKNKEVTSKSYSWFLPSNNKKNRKYFFHTMYNSKDSKTKFLNSFGVNGNEYGISGQSELITDNISFLRLAFGTVISASNKETQKDPALNETAIEALDRLVNGGGNFYLETILPFLTTIDRNNDDLTRWV